MQTNLVLTVVIFSLLLLLFGNLLAFIYLFKLLLPRLGGSAEPEEYPPAAPPVKRVFKRATPPPTTPVLVENKSTDEAADLVQHKNQDDESVYKPLDQVDHEVLAAAIAQYGAKPVEEEE